MGGALTLWEPQREGSCQKTQNMEKKRLMGTHKLAKEKGGVVFWWACMHGMAGAGVGKKGQRDEEMR
jgi:hypothetical protein